ncbi:hypothetical protein FOHLNKBM_6368 [Methylobacterium longum]|nr:hypothetical protein FOHLNKBM_6368 [Methylobacterium longum]
MPSTKLKRDGAPAALNPVTTGIGELVRPKFTTAALTVTLAALTDGEKRPVRRKIGSSAEIVADRPLPSVAV